MRNPKTIIDRLRWRLGAIHDDIRETRDEARAARAETDQRLAAAEERSDRIEAALGRIQAENDELRERWTADRARFLEILQRIAAEEPVQRRRLHEVRRTPEYERAYTDPDPLVTVIMPTYDNHVLMGERGIPSVLAQTHENLELLIVGDTAPPEAEEVARSFDDPRIRYSNLPVRGRYGDDPLTRWYVAGSLPFNEALSEARGLWIAAFADDDAMRPDHLEKLLAAARRDRHEVVYGRFEMHYSETESELVGEWPPRLSQINLQASIQHAALSFFENELIDQLFDQPNDWAKVERMLRAGVRFGMIDDVLVDYYPSRWWNTRGVPPGAEA